MTCFSSQTECYGILGWVFGLILSFLSSRCLMVLDGKSLQEHPVNAGVPQGSILGPTLIFLMMSVIFLSMLMILLSTVSVIKYLICRSS